MSCTRPIIAERYNCPATGLDAIRFRGAGFVGNLELPCNKCPSCKLKKAREWALRCWHESQMHQENAYVTFTYADKNLPAYEDLDHRDFQLFLKRLRKNTGRKISYFMCGEYGGKTHRPHFHAILFGYYPPDAIYHRTERGNTYYKSAELDEFWRQGFTDTSSVTYNSAGYVARYTLKKQLASDELQDRYFYFDHNDEVKQRKFEYVRMSLNPAIGLSWAMKYGDQWAANDYVLTPKGQKVPVPKYYLDVLKEDSEKWHAYLAAKRLEKAQNPPDNSPSLAQKEICVEARLKQLPRPYL